MKFLISLIKFLTGYSMGLRENKVERYLDSEVMKLGGITRKWVSPGVDGVPDRIVFLNNRVFFVEVKTVDGRLSQAQIREIKRLRDHGADVRICHGATGVDTLMGELRNAR